jgi:hypothetical protein
VSSKIGVGAGNGRGEARAGGTLKSRGAPAIDLARNAVWVGGDGGVCAAKLEVVGEKDGGGNTALNLLALCGHCHDLHTNGHIPQSAIVYLEGNVTCA